MRIAVLMALDAYTRVRLFDGFVERQHQILNALQELQHEVVIVPFVGDTTTVPQLDDKAKDAGAIKLRSRPTRFSRPVRAILSIAAGKHPARAERSLISKVALLAPDVVVAFGPLEESEFRSVFCRWPTVYFAEENLDALRPAPSTRLRARVLRYGEQLARRRSFTDPSVVCVISPQELTWATERYKQSPAVHVPLEFDAAYWRTRPDSVSATRSGVLSVGAFNFERNAAGLEAVLDAYSHRYGNIDGITVVSGGGLHPRLRRFAVESWFEHIVDARDLRPYYLACRVVLVPSFIVTGTKSTVLQGLASNRPVVSTTAAQRSVSTTELAPIAAGETPEEVAVLLFELLKNHDRRRALTNGAAGFLDRYNSRRSIGDSLARALASVAKD